MSYSISKIYDNYKTTIPKKIREFLEIQDGNELLYKIEYDIVSISKNELPKKGKRFRPL